MAESTRHNLRIIKLLMMEVPQADGIRLDAGDGERRKLEFLESGNWALF
jgi:hypothetical protein